MPDMRGENTDLVQRAPAPGFTPNPPGFGVQPPPPPVASPSQQVVEDANRVAYGTDARGRNIGVMRLTMSRRRRALKALSAESADKAQYVGLASVACCVVSIDGRPLNFPTSEMILDALIDELDDEGFTCVNEVLAKEFPRRKVEEVKN